MARPGYFTQRRHALAVFGPGGNELMPFTTRFVQALLGNNGAFPYLSDFVEDGHTNSFKIKTYDVPLERGQIQTYPLDDFLSLQATAVHLGPVVFADDMDSFPID